MSDLRYLLNLNLVILLGFPSALRGIPWKDAIEIEQHYTSQDSIMSSYYLTIESVLYKISPQYPAFFSTVSNPNKFCIEHSGRGSTVTAVINTKNLLPLKVTVFRSRFFRTPSLIQCSQPLENAEPYYLLITSVSKKSIFSINANRIKTMKMYPLGEHNGMYAFAGEDVMICKRLYDTYNKCNNQIVKWYQDRDQSLEGSPADLIPLCDTLLLQNELQPKDDKRWKAVKGYTKVGEFALMLDGAQLIPLPGVLVCELELRDKRRAKVVSNKVSHYVVEGTETDFRLIYPSSKNKIWENRQVYVFKQYLLNE